MRSFHGSSNRKKLLINKSFQLSFIGYTIGMVIALVGVFAAANNYFFWKFAKKGVELGLPADHVFFQFINEQRETMNIIFLITSIFAFVLLFAYGLYGLYVSNKMAGPLHCLTSQLQAMTKKGSSEQIKFRDKDDFQEVAQAFNDFIKSIK